MNAIRSTRAGLLVGGLALSFLLSGCGSSSTAPACPPGGCTRTVTVRNVDAFWTSAGKTEVQDESLQFAAVFGSPSSPTRVAATQPAVGTATYVIPGVPIGTFWLESRTDPSSAPVYTEAAADLVDVGGALWGRAGGTVPTTPTPVTLTFENLAPWTPDTDAITYFSAEAGAVSWAFGWYSYQPDPWGAVAGDMTATGTDAYERQRVPVIDPARGDRTWFVQLATRGFPPYSGVAQVASRYHESSTFGITPGAAQSFTVPLVEPATWWQVPVDLRLSRFTSYLADLNPSATASAAAVSIQAYPLYAPGVYSSTKGAVELLHYDAPGPTFDVNLGDVPMGWSLPAPWTAFREVRYTATRQYRLPGTSIPVLQYLYLLSYEAVPGASSPIQPVLTPVRSLAIGGAPAYDDRTGVGVTPTLSWEPPALVPAGPGLASTVYVYRLSASGTQTRRTLVATFRGITGNSVTIPPGILEAGQPHYAAVVVYTAPVSLPPHHVAWAATGVFAP